MAISVIPPIPTEWWLRPDSNAARVGEHNAVVWNRVYFNPPAARRSAVGVDTGPPNALDAPNPTSSSITTNTFGAPAGGRSLAIGGYDVSGSAASYVVNPTGRTCDNGNTTREPLTTGLSDVGRTVDRRNVAVGAARGRLRRL